MYIHTYIYTYIYIHIHTYIHKYINTYINTYMVSTKKNITIRAVTVSVSQSPLDESQKEMRRIAPIVPFVKGKIPA